MDGFLFEPGNHENLANKIIDVINNKDIAKIGKIAREKITSVYGHTAIAEKTIKVYENVLRGEK